MRKGEGQESGFLPGRLKRKDPLQRAFANIECADPTGLSDAGDTEVRVLSMHILTQFSPAYKQTTACDQRIPGGDGAEGSELHVLTY